MPPSIDSSIAKRFAREVVVKLRNHGFEAYWAGGCVRDQLMDKEPKDYDVATAALPDQVQEIFGRNRAHAVGAAFGVINIRGPKGAGHIEIATFREDQEYLDGRRPVGVTFTSAEEDAKRRDFTINGLFYDPIEERVLDFVGGEADLKAKIIRAIGDPFERIAEDRLRMLRAVRFAARMGFSIDPRTVEAIRDRASEIEMVSRERITAELELMLTDPKRLDALELLDQVGLVHHLSAPPFQHKENGETFQTTRSIVAHLHTPTFANIVAAWIWPFAPESENVEKFCRDWRISNDDRKSIIWLVRHADALRHANALPWPKVQRLLIQEPCQSALRFLAAQSKATGADETGITYCQECLRWPETELNPEPLLDGNDLQQLGLAPCPEYKSILDEIRDKQLNRHITTTTEARQLASELIQRLR